MHISTFMQWTASHSHYFKPSFSILIQCIGTIIHAHCALKIHINIRDPNQNDVFGPPVLNALPRVIPPAEELRSLNVSLSKRHLKIGQFSCLHYFSLGRFACVHVCVCKPLHVYACMPLCGAAICVWVAVWRGNNVNSCKHTANSSFIYFGLLKSETCTQLSYMNSRTHIQSKGLEEDVPTCLSNLHRVYIFCWEWLLCMRIFASRSLLSKKNSIMCDALWITWCATVAFIASSCTCLLITILFLDTGMHFSLRYTILREQEHLFFWHNVFQKSEERAWNSSYFCQVLAHVCMRA